MSSKDELTEAQKVLWEEFCREFGFLTKDYDFSEPDIEIRWSGGVVSFRFYKKEIAVECCFEEREDSVEVLIIRLEDGKVPEDVVYVNDKGETVRMYLVELLAARGVEGFGFNQVVVNSELSKQRLEYRKDLLGEAQLLKKHAKDLLEGSSKIFDEYMNSEHYHLDKIKMEESEKEWISQREKEESEG